jgi:predicted glycosyltransferase
VLAELGRREDVHAVVVPRTQAQREFVRSLQFPSLIVPEHAVDAQSLIALADLVVSAGGTMNREAVALGTPVFTLFEGRLGAVDERLIAEGRLRQLRSPDQVELVKRPPAETAARVRRDPALLTDLLTA